jgi:2-polyprenyl-3-methyl-5-hydroxy-6-metoxy-1,4-benzoquinol methylase
MTVPLTHGQAAEKLPTIESQDAYDVWHTARIGDNPQPVAGWHLLARRYLGNVKGLKVLEIGCGRGAFARYLAEQGADVWAADFSPVAVAETEKLLAARGRALVADVQALPFPDESFDLVVSLETLEHVPDPKKGLAELVRVTRRGGRLIVTTPNYLNFMGFYRLARKLAGRGWSEAGQPASRVLFLFARVRALRKLGCRVDVVDGTYHVLPIPKWRAVRLDWLERKHWARWFAFHGLTVATRLIVVVGSRPTASPVR